MLVLPVRKGGQLVIEMEDFDITIAFLGMQENEARIGIDAPDDYNIRRGRRGNDNTKGDNGPAKGSFRDY